MSKPTVREVTELLLTRPDLEHSTQAEQEAWLERKRDLLARLEAEE